MTAIKDISIVQGKTFTLILRWETDPVVRKAITGVSFATGAPRLTVPGHNIPDGWRCAIYGVKGPKQLNAANNPPRDTDFHEATVIDPDTVELNDINPYDDQGNEWVSYISGGFLQYFTPVDLTGQTARMQIRDRPGGTLLASSKSDDAPKDILDFDIDNTKKTIRLTVAASDADDITWLRGVHEIEMVSSDAEPVVVPFLAGNVAVTKEVTT